MFDLSELSPKLSPTKSILTVEEILSNVTPALEKGKLKVSVRRNLQLFSLLKFGPTLLSTYFLPSVFLFLFSFLSFSHNVELNSMML